MRKQSKQVKVEIINRLLSTEFVTIFFRSWYIKKTAVESRNWLKYPRH